MISGYPRTLTLVAVIGAGLSAGVFFAFSTFVMKALDRLPDAQGMTAMQEINKAAPAPAFMVALFGTAAVCVALGVWAAGRLAQPRAVWLLIGCALYLVAIALTIGYHVPHNNALAVVNPSSSGAVGEWRSYLRGWIPLNHVRTATSLASAVIFALALRVD